MTSPAARHARAMALFHRALELPADQREAMLHTWAGDDPEVATRVRAMLVADAAEPAGRGQCRARSVEREVKRRNEMMQSLYGR